MPPTSSIDSDEDHAAHVAAAILNSDKYSLHPETRWQEATTQAQFELDRAAAYHGKNSPRERWKRAGFLVGRLLDSDSVLKSPGVHQVDAEQKHLETQHWLELVDDLYPEGSIVMDPTVGTYYELRENATNQPTILVKWYHKRWQEEDTTENFFKWLDDGQGKELSLEQCSRPQLEKETIRRAQYLSAEQRFNYLVEIDDNGKLFWVKNNQPVDTTAGLWMDAGDGVGVVPQNLPETPPQDPRTTVSTMTSASNQSGEAVHHVDQVIGGHKWSHYLQRYFTPRRFVQRLLRRMVHRNTWIYVSDKNFNIFVGIKETGNFQHSSFVAGGLVTSAGLITVKNGTIHTLSPLSGHYRTSINHFHTFLNVLAERGVDMRKVKVNKAEATLWGIERIAKWKGKKGQLIHRE